MRGPSLAIALFTYRLSISTSRFFSALRKFALSSADCSSLPTCAATRFLVKASVLRASSTRRPLINSRTSRAFCGETRKYRISALNSIVVSQYFASGSRLLAFSQRPRARSQKQFLPLRCRRSCRCRRSNRSRTARNSRWLCRYFRSRPHRVPLEIARETKLAQLVAHHVFGNVDRNELLAVVHRDRVPHHL